MPCIISENGRHGSRHQTDVVTLLEKVPHPFQYSGQQIPNHGTEVEGQEARDGGEVLGSNGELGMDAADLCKSKNESVSTTCSFLKITVHL